MNRQLEENKKDSRRYSKRKSGTDGATPSSTSTNTAPPVATPAAEHRQSASSSMFTSVTAAPYSMFSYVFGSSSSSTGTEGAKQQEMTAIKSTSVDSNPMNLNHYLDATGRIPNGKALLWSACV